MVKPDKVPMGDQLSARGRKRTSALSPHPAVLGSLRHHQLRIGRAQQARGVGRAVEPVTPVFALEGHRYVRPYDWLGRGAPREWRRGCFMLALAGDQQPEGPHRVESGH